MLYDCMLQRALRPFSTSARSTMRVIPVPWSASLASRLTAQLIPDCFKPFRQVRLKLFGGRMNRLRSCLQLHVLGRGRSDQDGGGCRSIRVRLQDDYASPPRRLTVGCSAPKLIKAAESEGVKLGEHLITTRLFFERYQA